MARARHASTEAPIVQLYMELEWIEPIVWRRVQLPRSITLGRLHRVIQAAMGWTDRHLHEFIIGSAHFGVPDPENDYLPYTVHAEGRIKLDTALMGRRHFDYLYDFGDNWEHKLRVEKTLPATPLSHPICVGGENACPPEDVGGSPGYEHFLRIVQDPRDPEHEAMLTWCGGTFEPTAFDIDQVNWRLKRIKL